MMYLYLYEIYHVFLKNIVFFEFYSYLYYL